MSQFTGAKNPPWARPQSDFISVSVASSMAAAANSLAQPGQVANTILPQPAVANPTVFSLGNSTPNLAAPQYTAQQVAALGLQAQQAAAVAASAVMSTHSPAPNNPVIPQPGIATPTALATTQVATVSYPTPRVAQPQIGPKQRVFTGTITKLHDNFGFVDEDVFFQTSCVKGTIPKTGDRVLVEATYNANMPFKWNATRIQVLPGQYVIQCLKGLARRKVQDYCIRVLANLYHVLADFSVMSGAPAGPMGFGNMNKSGAGVAPISSMMPSISSSGPGMGNLNPSASLPQSLMQTGQQGGRGPLSSARRNDPPRFERNRDRKRDIMLDKRDRTDRPVSRKRSRSRSPVKRNDPPHQRSPARRRPRIVPRYVVQVPKLSFDMKNSNVVSLKSRYTNMYIPSDFFNANFAWTQAFPIMRPYQLGNFCSFHLMHKEVEPLAGNSAVLDPPDTDHLYSAKVMLLACPNLEDLYHKSCALAEDAPDVQEAFVHPTRLLNFLVGLKGKNETMAIGGPWSPSMDGPNPEEDPKVLIKTAIRTTKALTGIDLSACTQWYRFAEVQYLRPEETHKGKHVQARVETTVIFFPDVWSCSPTRLEWGTLQAAYKKQLQRKLAAVSNEGSKDENSQAEGESESDQPTEPTHFSELDPKTMKIIDLRKELESRTLSSKGLKSQLIARLTKAIKTEQEKEEEKEQMEAEEEVPEEVKKNLLENEEKDDQKKKEEEEKKKKEEREKASLERKYKLPDNPAILVHPHPTAKNGKFDCAIMSLSVLLDYRPEDNKEHSFEVSLFAELFNEMLMRDFGFELYKALVKAPEKKEDDKKDKDKKSDDKASKEPSSKKKKIDDKEKKEKESDRKAYKIVTEEGKDKKKEEEKKGEGEKVEEDKDEEEDMEDDTEDKVKKDKDKKKEKKKYQTKEPALLLAFTYFDQNHCGYLLDKDVEEIIHTIGLQLSRAQVKKLVQKVISRDALNYRKLTDKPLPGQGEEENAENKPFTDTDLEKIAAGNHEYLSKLVKTNLTEKVEVPELTESKDAVKKELCGFVNYKGSMLDIESVMQRLEKSEKTRAEMEKQMQEFVKEKEKMMKSLDSKEETSQKLSTELKTLKQKLLVQEKITNNSEATSKKYLSALVESKEHLTAMMASVTGALGDGKDQDMAVDIKKEVEANGTQ